MTTTNTNQEPKAKSGYTLKAVVSRIADMDVDAAGNGEKTAWKTYTVLALLAMAKGMSKKELTLEVFGKGKASKTFHNMWSLAEKARNPMLGNYKWVDVAQLAIDDAFAATLGMLNLHMSILGVSSKNEYDKYATFTADEVLAAKEREKAEKEEILAAKHEAETAAKLEAANAEVAALEAASKRAERTPATAAIAALQVASRNDLLEVMAHITTRINAADLAAVHHQLGEIISNIENSNKLAAAV